MKGLLFTYAMTYGGALAALLNPYYGFLVYVCFGIVRPTSMWPWSVPAGNYSRIVAAGLLLGWLLHGMGNWSFGRAKAVLGALLAFWGLTLVSTILAPQQLAAWDYFEQLAKILLPLVVGCTLMDTPAKVWQLVWVIALSQGYVAYEMNMAYFAGYNRLLYEGFASLDNNAAAITMVTGAGLTFFLALHDPARWRKIFAAGLFVLLIHAVLFSFSRGAMLSLLVSGGAAFLILPKRPVYVAALVVAALIGFRLAGEQVMARFVTAFADEDQRDASAESRIALWKACAQEMGAHPLTGLGADQWKFNAHHHGFEYGKAPHSMWMQTGAECGIPALLALVAFYGLNLKRLWRLTAMDEEANDSAALQLSAVARMVVCSLCGFVVGAQFVSVNLVEIPFYVAAAGIGVLKVASQREAEAELESQMAWHDASAPWQWAT